MVTIASDTTPVANAITRLLESLGKHGARFNDRLAIICRNGELSIRTTAIVPPEQVLIGLLAECLLPVDDSQLSLSDHVIRISDHNPAVSPARREIMERVIDVFNPRTRSPGIGSRPFLLYGAYGWEVYELLRGNTLLRTILWHCFGLRSASIYRNDLGGRKALEDYVGYISTDLMAGPHFPADGLPLVKTHEYPQSPAPAIYVVRDGRAASISLWNFYNRSCLWKMWSVAGTVSVPGLIISGPGHRRRGRIPCY